MGRGESEMANQAQIPFITDLEEQEPQLSDDCSSGDRNTDRLRRNRESAKRCRLRRKEYIQGVETKCKTLEEENRSLVEQNSQLNAIVDQLLAKNGASPDCLEFDASPCKRIKIEEGVTSADFANESAAGDSNLSAGQSDHLSVFGSVNTSAIRGLNPLNTLDNSCLDTDNNSSSPDSCTPQPGLEDAGLLQDESFWFDDLQEVVF